MKDDNDELDAEMEELFTPTPKKFLQTKEQKQLNAREEESRQARREIALKKVREKKQAHEERRNQLKKQRAHYDKLSAEPKSHIIRHAHLDSIASLEKADPIAFRLCRGSGDA